MVPGVTVIKVPCDGKFYLNRNGRAVGAFPGLGALAALGKTFAHLRGSRAAAPRRAAATDDVGAAPRPGGALRTASDLGDPGEPPSRLRRGRTKPGGGALGSRGQCGAARGAVLRGSFTLRCQHKVPSPLSDKPWGRNAGRHGATSRRAEAVSAGSGEAQSGNTVGGGLRVGTPWGLRVGTPWGGSEWGHRGRSRWRPGPGESRAHCTVPTGTQ